MLTNVITQPILYNNYTYYKNNEGYYRTSQSKGAKRLHVQMYQDYWNCVIPKGFVVHHKDDDKENNTLENYFLLTRAGHQRWHGKSMSDETKEKMRKAKLGTKRSDETKEKIRIANIGKHSQKRRNS